MYIGQQIGRYIVEDFYWNDDTSFVIATNLVCDTDGDWYSLECYYNDETKELDFIAVYEHDNVPMEEMPTMVTDDEVSEFRKVINEYKKLTENL